MATRKSYPKKNYEIEKSPLFAIQSKKKLYDILGVTTAQVSPLLNSDANLQYRIFTDKNTRRFITEPFGDRKFIHKRLAKLLARISPPAYIHSATKKRSYKSNALAHANGGQTLKIDIKKFFPSIKFDFVFYFFSNILQCSIDVATILTKLCTVKTKRFGVHLPTGSCISPILSFYANKRLFDSISELCAMEKCVFTVYVDDITISGEKASPALLMEIAKKIHNHGYQYHKIKHYKETAPLITGLIVDKGRVCLPHIRIMMIRQLTLALSIAEGKAIRHKLLSSLIGRLAEAEYIDPIYKGRRQRVMRTYSDEWKEITKMRSSKSSMVRSRKKLPTQSELNIVA